MYSFRYNKRGMSKDNDGDSDGGGDGLDMMSNTAPSETESRQDICLMSVTQAAKYLGVERKTLYDAIAAQRLTASRLMGRTALRKADVDLFRDNELRPSSRRGQAQLNYGKEGDDLMAGMSEGMSEGMSAIERSAAAAQYQQLTDFALFLQAQSRLRESPEQDAARYLRYFHGFTPEKWKAVAEFHASKCHPATGKIPLPAQHPSEDVPEYEISGVAMQFRFLFAFAAQYTVHAAEVVSVFLKDHHGYNADEWDDVLAFLESQEENWKP